MSSREIYQPRVDKTKLTLSIGRGGSGGLTAVEAAANLHFIPNSAVNAPNGISGLTSLTKIPDGNIPSAFPNLASAVKGPTNLSVGQRVTYTITDYDSFAGYTLTAIAGTVSRSGEVITYVAPSSVPPGGIAGFTLNGRDIVVFVNNINIKTPSITSPVSGATNQASSVTLTSNAFGYNSTYDTHEGSDWQLATDINFTNVHKEVVNDGSAKTSWTVKELNQNTTYYARVAHKGTISGYGGWSSVISFTTKALFIPENETAILTASDKASNDGFGYDVSVTGAGDVTAIGSPMATAGGFATAGKAYLYRYSNGSWSEKPITASDKAAGDQFGYSVALSGDGLRAVIGAPFANGEGKVYLFLWDGTNYIQETILTAADGAVGDDFGSAVSIDYYSTRVVVGAPNADFAAITSIGAVYVFSRSGSAWSQEAKLQDTGNVASTLLGCSVSIVDNGDRLIAGASGYTDTIKTGAVYVYARTGTIWYQEERLVPSDAAADDSFGHSAEISGDSTRMIGGSYGGDDLASNTGKAYIFKRAGTTWTEEAKLTASDRAADDSFGYSVSINKTGNNVLIGAYAADPSALSSAGKVYTFSRSGSTWTQRNILTASDKAAGFVFGRSVSLNSSGDVGIMGSKDADSGIYTAAGKAYIFK